MGRKRLAEDKELVWWVNRLYYTTELTISKIAQQVRHSEPSVSKLILSKVEYELLDAALEDRLKEKLNELQEN
jgi:DNA-binding transcriptional regulator LsrR (DeoR family)